MDILDRALCFAIEKHGGQVRKTGGLPYILHPLEVATIVGTMTNDKETLAAAVLHDTVEDTDTTLAEIAEEFGERVSFLVKTETENKREGLPPSETWRIRKEETLATLEAAEDTAVKMLWLGDKLSNMRSFCRLYRESGDALWQNFNEKDPAAQAWYYRKVALCLRDLEEYDAYKEYVRLVNTVFENVMGEIEE